MIPCLRYRDAPGAIDWLCEAFGFARQLVVEPKAGEIAHAQLVFGRTMVMLGSVDNGSEYGRLTVRPDEIGGRVTQSPYVVDENPDAHRDRAVAAGARVLIPLADWDHGGRGYSCADLEGHVWSFGSYDPWAS